MALEPRHVPAGTEISYATADGSIRTLRSRELEGSSTPYSYIEPTTGEDVAILEGAGYKIARRAIAAEAGEPEPAEDEDAPPATGPITDTRGPGAPAEG